MSNKCKNERQKEVSRCATEGSGSRKEWTQCRREAYQNEQTCNQNTGHIVTSGVSAGDGYLNLNNSNSRSRENNTITNINSGALLSSRGNFIPKGMTKMEADLQEDYDSRYGGNGN